jgi:hypothetical protein
VALEELAHAVQVAVPDGNHQLVVGEGGGGFHGAGTGFNREGERKHRDFGG